MEPNDDIQLHYSSHNPKGNSTIVLVHGAFTSGIYWDLVLTHLVPTYHVLIPDLPGHGSSHELEIPFSITTAAKLIAQLIRTKAINSHAHVIGHSLGAQVALEVAVNHPEMVDTLFISGFRLFPRTRFTRYIPYAVWMLNRVENLIPRSLVAWSMDGADIPRRDPKDQCTLDLCRRVMAPEPENRWPAPWPARTLIVAATKGGLVPSDDHLGDAERLMRIGRQGNPDTIAYVHPAMRHPWNRQAPKLFADTAGAWIEGTDLPEGFIKIE